MRIIGGEHGGRKFNPPAKMPYTRPTTDLAKEGLFNILQHSLVIEDLKTLDLFGGTGSISYELASRGVNDMTIVEKDPVMYDFIKKTAKELKIAHLNIVKMDVFTFIGSIGIFTLFLLFIRFLPMVAMSEVKAVLPEADPHYHPPPPSGPLVSIRKVASSRLHPAPRSPLALSVLS